MAAIPSPPASAAEREYDPQAHHSPLVRRLSGGCSSFFICGVTVAAMTITPEPPDPARPDGQLVELAGRRRVAPDEMMVSMPRGARALVFSDLRLANPATDMSREVCRSVARAIDECRGPAAVVFNGDTFDLRDGTDIDAALIAHPRLAAALAAFVEGDDHRLVVLPGIRDSVLAHDQRAHRRGDRPWRRGGAVVRARSRHGGWLSPRARRARTPARPLRGVRRPSRSQRPPAGSTSRARGRSRDRQRQGFECVAERYRRAR